MIFGTNSFVDNAIGMTQVLADNLLLKSPEAEVKVETLQLNLADSKDGLPNFPIASKVEITPIYNQAYEAIYEASFLKKIQLEPFYFKLGQEIRIEP